MNTKKEYLAPTLSVVTIKNEKGYAASNGKMRFSLFSALMTEPAINSNQETWAPEENLFDTW